ncbi:Aste57867_9634 [Aphanomyces stellatus]|uniref:Aste57867_9634 protein n=1 Tax=Aphanomyces stellatus TaxID=120398 RepID=A0A485KNF8_9STRA|nr:hypothetical protein As57867_009596 [Aphanomyces stellatus]VFT86513.1 Aste57867_9634 [Aphanomyces stellatus]
MEGYPSSFPRGNVLPNTQQPPSNQPNQSSTSVPMAPKPVAASGSQSAQPSSVQVPSLSAPPSHMNQHMSHLSQSHTHPHPLHGGHSHPLQHPLHHPLPLPRQPPQTSHITLAAMPPQGGRPVQSRGLPPPPFSSGPMMNPPHRGDYPPYFSDIPRSTPQQSSVQQSNAPQPVNVQPTPPNSAPGPPRILRELRVEDALLYLDQVKQQFGDQPDVYNQFLDVMKEFKSNTIDTPGVIQRVSELFKGHPNLIFGFNTFLPPGYRIRPESIDLYVTAGAPPPPSNGPPPSSSNAPLQVVRPAPPGGSAPLPPLSSNASSMSSQPSMTMLRPPPVTIPASSEAAAINAASNQPSSAKNKPPSTKPKGSQPVEFDHAILYVTTIKKRFADEPETYKAFLEILHTYQKEQGSIKQVLDQVSFLFRDHPDLLREFTFFLPDAVQEQAKERLNKAAEKAQQRQAKMAQAGGSAGAAKEKDPFKKQKPIKKESSSLGKKETPPPPPPKDDKDVEWKRAKLLKERERGRNKQQYDLKRKHKSSSDTPRRELLAMSQTLMDPAEWNMFEKIKKCLPSRDSWREFLKCLELYAQEIVGRDDMLVLVKNLLGRHTDVIAEFAALLQTHGEAKDQSGGEIWPFIPLAETDLSQCRRATPSYRALPASYPLPPCSFRNAMERNVCNDAWVSVPTGSEDFSFKSMRKNQYEEALFKCEDERFEIDMVIDANAATIAILAPLAKELSVLSTESRWNYVLDKHTLRVTHLNAIARIYGESGHQILDLLAKHPAGAIPVILKRLQQKDDEWRRARQDLNKQWKDVNEKNYHKSLDHSSFYFKQKDKKALSAKFFLSEAKKALDKKEAGSTFLLPAAKIHKDAFGLLTYAAEKLTVDKEKVSKIWTQYFFPFFQLDEAWLKRKPVRASVSVDATMGSSLLPGTEVLTDFGEGVVKHVDATRGVATVQLVIGVAYLQIDSITIQEAADFPPNVVVSDDPDVSPASRCFGSEAFYVFVRLYQVLYSRLEQARELCEKAKRNRNRRTINPAAAMLAHAHHVHANEVDSQTGDYEAFMSKLYALIDQSIENPRYEDCCRSLMGSSSYFLFTMDKLVTLLLKQMQHMATDDACQKLAALYQSQLDAPLDKAAYFAAAKPIFEEENEGAFWMEFASGVLRKTPLDQAKSGAAASVGDKKLWAPSPRTKHTEPSKWLVEPKLVVEYLGSVEGDDSKDETTLSEEDESGMSESESVKSGSSGTKKRTRDAAAAEEPTALLDDESAAKRKKD